MKATLLALAILPAFALAQDPAAEKFEKKYLQVGKVAPEIKGFDQDGKPFKLSSYRGKVVLLDFFGFW